MSRPEFADGVERFLGGVFDKSVKTSGWSQTSAGARRTNVLFDAAWGKKERGFVATMTPNASIQLKSATDEAAIISAAGAAGVPVPDVIGATDDPGFVGGPMFVTARVDGESVPRRVLRLVAAQDNGEQIVRQMGDAFARLHAMPTSDAPLPAPARPGDTPAAAALAGLEEQMKTLLQPSPVFTLAMRWLERRMPAGPVDVSVIHGDLRNGNILISSDGLAAVLDWELARLGDPMEDLAWPCLRTWRFGNDAAEVGGFGSRDALAAAYEAAGGRFDLARFHWWKVVGTLRWGLGLAGQARAHLDGSVPSIVMCASGRRVGELEWDLLTLIKPR